MAYFLKKSIQQNRTYLAIYESFYSPEAKGTKHKCFKTLGNIDALIASGIDDPIAFYQEEVNRLNLERINERHANLAKQISVQSPERYLGYFPLAHVLNSLDIEEHFNYMQSNRNFHFNAYDIFSSLIFARAVAPLSKHKTFHDVLPCLSKDVNFSYDQLLDSLDFLGSEHERFIEILTVATKENFGINTKNSYFDCTNFYFEIDKESNFQKRGPSKELRKDPIVGMGLLLDSNMIPIGMRMYPGNESEKPVLRELIRDLKMQNNIKGRTIQIADKGLNCAQNIIEATNHNDGYLFSKSVKQLPEKEKVWVLLKEDLKDVFDTHGNLTYQYKSCVDSFTYCYVDQNGRKIEKTITEKRVCTFNPKLASKKLLEIDRMVNKARQLNSYLSKKEEYGECSRYVKFTNEDGRKPKAILNEAAIEKDRMFAGYNLLVTSEIDMSDEAIYEAYHNLWRIEESFRIMKSELDARPVYLQKKDRIIGHFLICYATVLCSRILEFKILKNQFSSSQLYNFYRDFKVVKIDQNRYINMTRASEVVKGLAVKLKQPIMNYYLTDNQIKMMHTR